VALSACGEILPADIEGFEDDCELMNRRPFPPAGDDDPHDGFKNVYACNVPLDDLEDNKRPFPEGTIIIKTSTREGEDEPWLIATARKRDGEGVSSWRWDEYTRNFEDEDFRRIPVGQSTCTDCHKDVESVDSIFTFYQAR